MNANITDIKKFAVHDGDGIRTTVFFKGCPLKCVWCHNPETIKTKQELAFYAHKCSFCGRCASVCKNHTFADGKHIIDKQACTLCGNCVNSCLNEALTIYGKTMPTDDICNVLLEDRAFYETSGGGITLSGGECLLQPDACREILINMKNEGINTAVDTCGAVPFENIEKVMDYTDVFLYDIKAIDEDVHIKCTGKSNKLILENLKKIDEMGKKIEIRYPYVPGFNDNQADKILEFVKELKNLVRVRVLAYHDFARSKYAALNCEDTLPTELPDNEILEQVRDSFRKQGIECIE